MARSQNKLSPLVVKNLKQKGLYADGGGLYLRVGESGNKSWIFRFRRHGKLRDMGLGALHTITLAEARTKAVDCRKLLLAGLDPLDTKKSALTQAKLAAVKGTTFESCAKAYTPYLDPERAGRVVTENGASKTVYAKDHGDPDKPHVFVSDDKLTSELFALPTKTKQFTAGHFDGQFPHVIYQGEPEFRGQGYLLISA